MAASASRRSRARALASRRARSAAARGSVRGPFASTSFRITWGSTRAPRWIVPASNFSPPSRDFGTCPTRCPPIRLPPRGAATDSRRWPCATRRAPPRRGARRSRAPWPRSNAHSAAHASREPRYRPPAAPWRNGIRSRFKIDGSQGHEGSTPSGATSPPRLERAHARVRHVSARPGPLVIRCRLPQVRIMRTLLLTAVIASIGVACIEPPPEPPRHVTTTSAPAPAPQPVVVTTTTPPPQPAPVIIQHQPAPQPATTTTVTTH